MGAAGVVWFGKGGLGLCNFVPRLTKRRRWIRSQGTRLGSMGLVWLEVGRWVFLSNGHQVCMTSDVYVNSN